jgi:hypothetical protein
VRELLKSGTIQNVIDIHDFINKLQWDVERQKQWKEKQKKTKSDTKIFTRNISYFFGMGCRKTKRIGRKK